MSTHHSPQIAEDYQQQRSEKVQIFLEYLRYERNLSAHTLASYTENLQKFENYIQQVAPDVIWSTMDSDIIRGWVINMMDEGNKASSVNTRLSALRSFYKFLLRRGYVTADPAHNITGPKAEKALPSYIRDAEMDQLLDHGNFPDGYVGVRDRTILMTLYSAGLRASELLGLTLVSVDFSTKQLKVTGKRNKQRIVPFGQELEDTFRDYLQHREQLLNERGMQSQAFFLSERTGRPMDYQALRVMVNRYLSTVSSSKRKSPHVLRHSFATTMLNHQADLRSVKELLGHESLATTEIYTHATFAELQQAYQKAHPRATIQEEGSAAKGE